MKAVVVAILFGRGDVRIDDGDGDKPSARSKGLNRKCGNGFRDG